MGNNQLAVRAKVRRQLRAGSAIGQPLAEWAYTSPRFPNGYTLSDPEWSSPSIQQELVAFWFLANFEPFQIKNWSEYFAFGRTPFGTAPLAPSSDTSERIITSEFGKAINPAVLKILADTFQGHWTYRIERAIAATGNAQEQIISRLDAIIDALEALTSLEGGIGHNSGMTGPLDDIERTNLITSIKIAKKDLSTNADLIAFEQIWAVISPCLEGFGKWLVARINDFATSYVKSAGESLGKYTPHLILAAYVGTTVWNKWAEIQRLLETLGVQ